MNIRIHQLLSSTSLTTALLFSLLTLVIAQTSADEANVDIPISSATAYGSANTLPDLGTPAANTGSVQPSINAQGAGFNYHDNIDGKLISINPKYNEQGGASIGGSFSTPVAKNMAVGILLTAGSDKNEWLLNTGFDLTSNQRFIFSIGQLRQSLDFNFISGNQRTQVTQNNVAGSYQYFLGKDWLNAAELNAYFSDTGSIKLSDKTYYTDSTSLYELWSDPRRIAGGRVTGAQGRLVFTPTSTTTIKVGLGAESLTYNYLTGNDTTTRATGSAELTQRLENGFNVRASANAAASQNRYALGLGRSFSGGSQLGIDLAAIRGRDNTFNDNQLLLSFTQSFGGHNPSGFSSNPMGTNNTALNNPDASGAPMNQMPDNTATTNPNANTWASSLVDQVSRRPSFLPAQVIAKVDNTATPTRLISIDKTGLPTGSSVAIATGILTVPIGTAVRGIAGVTLNGSAFSNGSQFTLSGSTNLVINPNLITQPSSTDTYVVTMNNSTGTTLATITVMHGSKQITSVVISSGQIAQTITFGALSSKLATDANFSLSATASSALSVSFASNSLSVCTVASSTVTLVAPGTCSITASQVGNEAYIAATDVTQTFTVSAIVPTLSGFSPINKTYGNAAFSLTSPTTNSAGAFTYTSSNTAVATISGSTVTIIGAGSSTITATQAASGNYASTTTTAILTVATAGQTTLTAIASPTSIVALTGTSTLSTSGGSGSGAVTYSSTGGCTISGTTLTAGATVGTCSITATKAADSNYAVSTNTVNVTVTAVGTQATPTFSPAAGAIAFGTTVTITSAGADTIYYTTDGTIPSTSSTNQATTPLVINAPVTAKALAVKAGYTNSAIATAAYTQAVATAPNAITLAVGSSTPVGGITNVAIPAVSGTDTTGAVTGWVTSTANKIKFTVTAGSSGTSSITINDSAYTSAADYTITAASALTIVVTTTETNKATAVRTFTVSVAAPVAPPAGYIVSGGLTWAPITMNETWNLAKSTCESLSVSGITGYAQPSTDNPSPIRTWRQPTKDELVALYNSHTTLTGWTLNYTWSSTDVGADVGAGAHYLVDLDSGSVGWIYDSYDIGYVSCVH